MLNIIFTVCAFQMILCCRQYIVCSMGVSTIYSIQYACMCSVYGYIQVFVSVFLLCNVAEAN